MATQAVPQQSTLTPNVVPIATPKRIVPIKVGFMGEQGSGKTSSAALLSVAISKQFHGGAPVWVTDPELGWQFLRPVIFNKEGVRLEQCKIPTFKAMCGDLARAEKEGACVWNVELGKIWIEILRTLQKAKPYNWGSDLVYMWNDFIAQFLNSKLHCMVLGRIQDIVEEIMNEQGESKTIKVAEGMKAGGQRNNFGYEPHLVLRMNLEQRPRVKKGKTFENEGRMVHRAKVTKDRTWATNGKIFRWADRDSYRAGDFRYVWEDIRAHFLATQETEGVALDAEASSADMLDENGASEYRQRLERKEVLRGELHATMEYLFGGSSNDAKKLRIQIFEHVFGFKSKEAADAASLDKIERGVRILQAFEKRCKREHSQGNDILAKGELEILAQLDIDINEYDQGLAEEQELPF